MNFPTRETAHKMLTEAGTMNPGAWTRHSETAARIAERIARLAGMDADWAYVAGLLHDIGRRYGVTALKHVYDGYHYLTDYGCDGCARIAMTHSFPVRDFRAFGGANDCSPAETESIVRYLENAVYDDYDRLLQLSDALAGNGAPVSLEKRLADVAARYGTTPMTEIKNAKFFELKRYFETKTNRDLDLLLGIEK